MLLEGFAGPEGSSGAAGTELFLAAAHLLVSLALAAGLWRARRWSWWGAMILTAGGLFFLLPVVTGVLLGAGAGPSRNELELALLLGSFVALVLLLGILVVWRGGFGIRWPFSTFEE